MPGIASGGVVGVDNEMVASLDLLDDARDGFAAVDRAWRVVYLNERAASLLGLERAGLVGSVLWERYPELAASALDAPLRAAMDGDESLVVNIEVGGRWLRVSLIPSAAGFVAHIDEGQRRAALPPGFGASGAEAAPAPPATADGGVYRDLFHALDEGFCIVEVMFDDDGAPYDYRFLEVNAVFEQHTGLSGARGRTARDLVPDLERHWFEVYGRIALTGVPERFVSESKPMDDRTFDVYAFRVGVPERRQVAIHFTDISGRIRAEKELRYRSEQVQTLIERAPVGVYLVDADFRLAQVNPAARPVFGDIPDLIGRDFAEVVGILWPPSLAEAALRQFRHTLETGESFHDPELAEVRADRGVTEYYDWRIDRILLPDGRYGAVCYFNDISEQVAARRAIVESEGRYRTLFESIDEGFCILHVLFDEGGRAVDYRYVETNPTFEQQTGLEDALGHTIRELVPDIEPFWFDVYGRVARTGEATRFVDHAESMGRWFDVYAFRVGEADEHKVAVLFRDITERKRSEEALRESEARLHHRANHDLLTELPNRMLFEDRLRQAIAAASRHQRTLALLFVDLDGFKLINDSLGHAAGDAVLVEVARRLELTIGEGETLARLHGDEFTVLVPEVTDPDAVVQLGRALLEAVRPPIDVGGRLLTVSASVGVSTFPQDADDAAGLLRAADAAMYGAKLAGKNKVRSFTKAMHAPAVDRLALIEHVEGVLDRDELMVLYQPQWDRRIGSVSTFEGVLRWRHPTLGDVGPARFVPIAEERGVFGPIMAWSLDACGAFLRALSVAHGLPLRVGVDVTAGHLLDAAFRHEVESVLERYGLAPRQLELEVAAGAYFDGAQVLRDAVVRFGELGVRVVLDRFGADVGLVAPILGLPLDGVKIDPKLVRRAEHDGQVRRGLRSVVGVVHDLGIEVTAVGVESSTQRDLMLEIGCERLQGTLVGEPMSRAGAEALLRGQQVATLF